jgi:hypothetical protein
MPQIHGKKTVVLLGGVDLTQNSNNSQLEFTPTSTTPPPTARTATSSTAVC